MRSFWSEIGYFSLWLVWDSYGEFYLQLFFGGVEYRFFCCGRIWGTENYRFWAELGYTFQF